MIPEHVAPVMLGDVWVAAMQLIDIVTVQTPSPLVPLDLYIIRLLDLDCGYLLLVLDVRKKEQLDTEHQLVLSQVL